MEGCNGTSPTLVLERDKTYTMVQVLTKNTKKNHDNVSIFSMQFQEDITNWMHPLGFAYYPDGAHGFKQYAEVAFAFIELNARKVEVSVHINMFLLQVPELEEPHPETCNEQQFLCNPNNQSSKAQAMKASSEAI